MLCNLVFAPLLPAVLASRRPCQPSVSPLSAPCVPLAITLSFRPCHTLCIQGAAGTLLRLRALRGQLASSVAWRLVCLDCWAGGRRGGAGSNSPPYSLTNRCVYVVSAGWSEEYRTPRTFCFCERTWAVAFHLNHVCASIPSLAFQVQVALVSTWLPASLGQGRAGARVGQGVDQGAGPEAGQGGRPGLGQRGGEEAGADSSMAEQEEGGQGLGASLETDISRGAEEEAAKDPEADAWDHLLVTSTSGTSFLVSAQLCLGLKLQSGNPFVSLRPPACMCMDAPMLICCGQLNVRFHPSSSNSQLPIARS